MNQNLRFSVSLSCVEGFHYEAHLESMLHAGLLRSLEMKDGFAGGSDVHLVVAKDGTEWTFHVTPCGQNLTSLQVPSSESFPTEAQYKAFVDAIRPIWAQVENVGLFRFWRSPTSGGAHLFTLPHLAGKSFFGNAYMSLFSGRLLDLKRFPFCRTEVTSNGVWVEIPHSNLEELVSRRTVLEDFLLPRGPWEDEGLTRISHAVSEALLGGISFEAAVANMARWREERAGDALDLREEILAQARKEVKRYGKRRRPHDVCTAFDDLNGILFGWGEGTFEDAVQDLDRVVRGRRIKWSAILHDFVKVPYRRGFKTRAKCVIYNSCMQQVGVCELEA